MINSKDQMDFMFKRNTTNHYQITYFKQYEMKYIQGTVCLVLVALDH